jgi:hypothetical protein
MDRDEFVASIDACPLHNELSGFFRFYTEDRMRAEDAIRIFHGHLYTLTAWGEEVWVHRGEQRRNRLGYLVGRVDLGPDFRLRLWTEPL